MAKLKPFRFSLPVYDVVGKRGVTRGTRRAHFIPKRQPLDGRPKKISGH
jgi:hypothetical protein